MSKFWLETREMQLSLMTVVENAVVKAKIIKEKKGKKIIVFKFKRRKDYRNKNGHRQRYTTIEITDILN